MINDMSLGEELEIMMNNATETQLDRFEEILEQTKNNDLLPHDDPRNDYFIAQILFRKELRQGI